jgi:hypothetical protein
MAKQGGLGSLAYVAGYDVSGDIQAFATAAPQATLDMTSIKDKAFERIGGLRSASLTLTSYFNKTGEHVPFSALPTADVQGLVCIGPVALGSPVVAQLSKQVDYPPTRDTAGMLTEKVELQSNGYGQEWGVALTAGTRIDTTGTTGATLDRGAGFTTPAVPLTTVPVTNTSPLPATVVISGGTVTTVLIGGVSAGSGDGTYTVPAGTTIAVTYSAAPTWTWTLATAFGFQAYLQAIALTGSTVTVTLQDSADNVTFTNVTSGVFTAVTSAPITQRLAVGGTAVVRRYVRLVTSGTFTSFSFAAMLVANTVAVSF